MVGVSDDRWGEVGCAVVVPKEGQTLDLAEIAAHCEQHLARFKHPQRLEIRSELPRNATGKVLKFVLREELSGQS